MELGGKSANISELLCFAGLKSRMGLWKSGSRRLSNVSRTRRCDGAWLTISMRLSAYITVLELTRIFHFLLLPQSSLPPTFNKRSTGQHLVSSRTRVNLALLDLVYSFTKASRKSLRSSLSRLLRRSLCVAIEPSSSSLLVGRQDGADEPKLSTARSTSLRRNMARTSSLSTSIRSHHGTHSYRSG